MNPSLKIFMARLLLLASLIGAAAVSDMRDVIAKNGIDTAVKEWIDAGAGASRNVASSYDRMRPKASGSPDLSVRTPELSVVEAKDLPGQQVTVRGTVVTDPVLWKSRGDKLSMHIEDDTGGIHVLMTQGAEVKKGDEVRITGTIAAYDGLIEMRSAAKGIQVVGSSGSAAEPRAVAIEDLRTSYKAAPFLDRLVKVKAQVRHMPEKPQGGAYRIPLTAGEGIMVTLYIREGGMDPRQIRDKAWYEITGMLSRNDGYRIMPGDSNDVRLLEPQP